MITGSTFAHNQALGGNGGSGPLCGNAVGGGIHNGVGTVATITGSMFDHNRAIGGSRGSGEFFPGNVLGGGVNNQGRATITESTFTHNLANGGSFNTGRNAGGGSGGGLFNAVPATLTLFGCTFDHNLANGGSKSRTRGGSSAKFQPCPMAKVERERCTMRLTLLRSDWTGSFQGFHHLPGFRRPSPPGRSAVPRLEVLEDRTMLSSLTVRNIADSGPGSLRTAIDTANTNGDPTNTITFAPRLAGRTITLTSGELAITKSLDIVGLGKHRLTIKRSSARAPRASGSLTSPGPGWT